MEKLSGRIARDVSVDDVLFTVGLLARIFEADLGLGMSETITILDELGLPTEMVPLLPRVQPTVAAGVRPSVTPCGTDNVVPFRRPQGARPGHCYRCSSRFRNAA
jgi:hypothetical protein